MHAARWLAASLALVSLATDAATLYRGFDISNLAIPRAELLPGGPPRDGIPALTDPPFVTAAKAGFLHDSDRVLGVDFNGVAKAYPLGILNWHEVVNDRFAGVPVAVTYCPLCYTGMAFLADFGGARQVFGVSGLLYNSDVVLYDRATESLWSQMLGQAISGPALGRRLEPVVVSNTTWAAWRARHADSQVLSQSTGYKRDYRRDPYGAYSSSREVLFPLRFRSQGFHPKQPVVGIVLDGRAKAYPLSELARAGTDITDHFAGRQLQLRFDEEHDTADILDGDGTPMPAVTAYWFAWYAFHPDTEVYRAAGP